MDTRALPLVLTKNWMLQLAAEAGVIGLTISNVLSTLSYHFQASKVIVAVLYRLELPSIMWLLAFFHSVIH